jgi:hypothetical protein
MSVTAMATVPDPADVVPIEEPPAMAANSSVSLETFIAWYAFRPRKHQAILQPKADGRAFATRRSGADGEFARCKG